MQQGVPLMARVTSEDREEHAALSGGRFPLATKAQCISAIRLRGHTRNRDERRRLLNAIIRRARREGWADVVKKAQEARESDGL
jgi:hypothetical protein